MSDHSNAMIRVMNTVIARAEDGPTDAELLTRFVDTRDGGAFECLVWRHGAMVFNVCRAITKDRHAAEDAVQAVFLALARGGRSIKNRHALAGWLHRVARRIAAHAAERAPRAETSLPTEGIPVDETCSSSERESFLILHDEIARLPDIYQTAIVLCFFEGLSHPMAAKRLGCPLGTLKGRVDAAKKQLAKRLAKRGVAPAAGIVGLLLAQGQTSLKAEFVATISQATAFASGATTIPGFSPTVLKMAHDALKTPLISRLGFAAVCIAGLSTIAIATNFALSGPKSPPPEVAAYPASVESALGSQVLAPIPKSGIDATTIARYEETGAFFGGFTINDDSTSISTIRNEHVFAPGEEAAKTGLPGFCWNRPPDGKFPELPKIDCNFGIQIRGTCDQSVLQSLKRLKNLKLLKVYDCRDADLGELAELKNLTSLTLTLVSDKAENSVKNLASLKNLKSLTLYSHRIDAARIKELVALEDLRYLSLNSAQLTDAAVKDIADLKNLESLTLISQLLSDAAVKDLSGLTNLRSLYLSSLRLTNAGVENLSTLKNLKSLTLDALFLNDKTIKTIASLNRLESLNLKTVQLTDACLKDLAALHDLKSLHLGARQITDAGVREFAAFKNLQTLSLNSQQLTDAALKNLTACESLKSITLCSPLITDAGIKEMVALKNLRSVEITSGKLTDIAVKDLVSLRHLESISLYSDNLTEAAAIELAALKNLHALSLHPKTLTNDWVKHLSPLRNLRLLTLTSAKLDDGCVKDLATFENLQTLAMPNAKFTEAGLRELREQLPRCFIGK